MNTLPILADFDFAYIIPVTALMIPIVAILTNHQRKMAELLHRNSGDNQLIANLQREVYELRQLVHQHAVVIDDLGMGRSLPPTSGPPSPPL